MADLRREPLAGNTVVVGQVAEENSMSAHPPPVPPDQRPKAGPQDTAKASVADKPHPDSPDGNLAEQGRAGNTKQNTTNKGYQHDR